MHRIIATLFLFAAGCARQAATKPIPPTTSETTRKFIGVWEDPDTATAVHFTIEAHDGKPTVVAAEDTTDSLERFDLTSSSYDQTEGLTWSYRVPSTGFDVRFVCSGVDGETMHCKFSNDRGMWGTQELRRVAEPARQ